MSSDDLNPTGPSQPNLDTVYKVSGNPADKEPAEKAESETQSDPNARTMYVFSTLLCFLGFLLTNPSATTAAPTSEDRISQKRPPHP